MLQPQCSRTGRFREQATLRRGLMGWEQGHGCQDRAAGRGKDKSGVNWAWEEGNVNQVA